jgi:glycosyltransferase involved in cell wall biosynthesis
MRVAHLSWSDSDDGSSRAAYRIHTSLQEAGIDSAMFVNVKKTSDSAVFGPVSKLDKAIKLLRPRLASSVASMMQTDNSALHSPAVMPSSWPRMINSSDIDIIHVHNVFNGMLSIGDLTRITKPILWTLHDMWAFCGAEHLVWDTRYIEGYSRSNRPCSERGFDLNRFVWNQKQRRWRRPIELACPSSWLAECASHSALMSSWPVTVIPNPLDTTVWKPIDRSQARDLLNLPQNVPLVLFGASDATANFNKGFDLLLQAMRSVRRLNALNGLELIVFGDCEPLNCVDVGLPIRYTGRLHDDLTLRTYYSAADMFVVPSRIESFCQTASEAQACGTPVVAFSTSGLKDVVADRDTGYLAQPYDPVDFANGMKWCLEDPARHIYLCSSARKRAENLWNLRRVAQLYSAAYQKVLEDSMNLNIAA